MTHSDSVPMKSNEQEPRSQSDSGAKTEYTVVVEVLERQSIPTFDISPQAAAARVETNVRFGLSMAGRNATIKVRQVDYETQHGGESHWYPND